MELLPEMVWIVIVVHPGNMITAYAICRTSTATSPLANVVVKKVPALWFYRLWCRSKTHRWRLPERWRCLWLESSDVYRKFYYQFFLDSYLYSGWIFCYFWLFGNNACPICPLCFSTPTNTAHKHAVRSTDGTTTAIATSNQWSTYRRWLYEYFWRSVLPLRFSYQTKRENHGRHTVPPMIQYFGIVSNILQLQLDQSLQRQMDMHVRQDILRPMYELLLFVVQILLLLLLLSVLERLVIRNLSHSVMQERWE